MSSSAELATAMPPSGRAVPRVGILRGLVAADPAAPPAPRREVGGMARPAGTSTLHDVRRTAEDAGYADGYAAGAAAARAELAAQVDGFADGCRAALAALEAALTDLRNREAAGLAQVADQAAALALAIAEEVVAREIASSDDPGRDAIARAIGLVPEEGDATIRLHPADAARVGEITDLLPGREVHLVPDPAVGSGGAVVQVGATRIDAQLSTALDRVREVLR